MRTKLLLLLLFAYSFANAQTITTFAGSTQGYVEGTGTAAKFYNPYGIAFDGGGAVVVTDQGNYKVRKIYSDQSTGLFAGSTSGYTNATGAAAQFGGTAGVARDGFNNAFVCDADNNAIRKITSSGVVTTIAGGTQGENDGTGTAAQFYRPYGIVSDLNGNLYVADTFNHRIRKISTTGAVTTLAGSTQGYADGTGAAAQFNYPFGITLDAAGNVYVGENCRIRKITPAGVVTTFAGGTPGFADGTGTDAQFQNGLSGITIDNSGNLYVADTYNYRIRKVSPAGEVTTYAGQSYSGSTDGDVTVATFGTMTGIAIDKTNNILYVTDYGNQRIRKITPPVPATLPAISNITHTDINHNSAKINYSVNANNGATTSVVKYGLSSGSLTSQVTGFSANGNSATPGNVNLAALSPNTQYFYQIEATNSAGTTTSAIGNFTTTSDQPITAYNFNNSYNNINGNTPFSNNAANSFTTDRYGVASSALNINNVGTTATIAGLPYGTAERTISLWVKLNTLNIAGFNYLFHYGTSTGGNGAYMNAGKIAYFGQDEHNASVTHTTNVWYHFVMTYDGATAKIYRDGVLLAASPKTWNTVNSSNVFRLGLTESGTANYFNGAVDDLKIYNYALSDAEVLSLHNSESPISVPAISSISHTNISHNSAKINYSLNANNAATTSVIKYGLSSGSLTSQVTGFSANGTSVTPGTTNLTGLSQNTLYYYQIEATNSAGTVTSTIGNFTTATAQIIAEYNFNNTYNNANGTTPFASNAGTSFLTDRHGNANSAIYISQTGTTATIPGLPYGGNTRTVSLWVKLDGVGGTYNFLYSYGTTGSPEGAFINPTSAIHFSPNNTATTTNSAQIWYHYVFTYDGTTSKIYKNGTLLNSVAVAKNTVNNSDLFRLGLSEGGAPNYFTGFIDDLKIYNYALSASEVANLYNNNSTLAVSDFSKAEKITVYPNPVKDILNINAEITKAEIFNLSGAKIKESKSSKIDMSKLSAGVYLLKITDGKGNVSSQKIIKN